MLRGARDLGKKNITSDLIKYSKNIHTGDLKTENKRYRAEKMFITERIQKPYFHSAVSQLDDGV